MAMSNPIEDHMTLQFWAALQRKDAGAVRNLINDGIDVNLPDRVSLLFITKLNIFFCQFI